VATHDILEEIRLRWRDERATYEHFCEVLELEVELCLRKVGIKTRVTSRPKEIDSLVKKAIKQLKEGRTPSYEGMVDKAGARAVVRFREEISEAVAALQRTFNCVKVEYKSERNLKEFDYRSCHIDLFLRETHPRYSEFGNFPAELQVRTMAQDLWADFAHELMYKSILRDLVPELQMGIDRRIYILSALVESADMEFSRINKEILTTQGAEKLLLLRALEREYYKYASREYDM